MRCLFATVMAAGLAGCGGESGPPPIYVGQVATLSGPDRFAGEQAMRGIRLAVQEQVKEAEKDKLRPIHVRHTDTRGKLEAFEGEAVRLVAVNRVVALLGGATPAEVIRLDKAQAPLLAPIGLRTRDMSEMVFLTGLSPAFQGNVLARFASKELKITAAISLVADERSDAALAVAEAFANAWATPIAGKDSKGSENRPKIWRFGKDRAVVDLAKALAETKPGALLFAGTPQDLSAFVKAMRPLPAIILFGGEDGASRGLLETPGANGTYLSTAYVRDLDPPRAKEFAAEFSKSFSEEPDVHAALAHDSARLLFEAIRACKSDLTTERLRKELGQLKDFPGITGPLAFRDRELRRPAFIVRLDKGKASMLKKYEPEELEPKK